MGSAASPVLQQYLVEQLETRQVYRFCVVCRLVAIRFVRRQKTADSLQGMQQN